MGYGDNEPPAIRADPFPTTLNELNGFRILILTFVPWDVIKFSASTSDGDERALEINSGKMQTEFILRLVRSSIKYKFTAQGCSKAVDGSTSYCSPRSEPLEVTAAENTNSVKQFLRISGINIEADINLSSILRNREFPISFRQLLGLERQS